MLQLSKLHKTMRPLIFIASESQIAPTFVKNEIRQFQTKSDIYLSDTHSAHEFQGFCSADHPDASPPPPKKK